MRKLLAVLLVGLMAGFTSPVCAEDVEVSGSDMEGDYVSGDIEQDGSEGEGYLYDTEGNQYNIEDAEETSPGEFDATDDEGESYDLDADN